MLQTTKLRNIPFSPYRKFISRRDEVEIRKISRKLKKVRILHVNATPVGGGVAEILQTLIPLMRDLSISVNWCTFSAPPSFYRVTKRIHDNFQGASHAISAKEWSVYQRVNENLAKEISRKHVDLLFIHDPQPLLAGAQQMHTKKILRMHIDLSSPNTSTKAKLLAHMREYDSVVFSLSKYKLAGLAKNKVSVFTPAIDPLSIKHKLIPWQEAKILLSKLGIDVNRPFISQISRFDIWKDPCGVIDAYRLAKRKIPTLQLALLGIMEAIDDPTAMVMLRKVLKHAAHDPDIHIIHTLDGIGLNNSEAVNVLQQFSHIILQKSVKEGFGMTVTEAMWKHRVVIGGNVGGIRLQIQHGKNGYLVSSSAAAAKYIIRGLEHRKESGHIGIAAQKSVRKKYLMPRLLYDHLKLYQSVLQC